MSDRIRERVTGSGVPVPAGETILVTGGAGFVGSHLARVLAPDNEVRVIDDLSTGKRSNVPEDVTFVEGDIRDDAALERAMTDVDVVFHQAGLVSVPASIHRPHESLGRNVAATVALLERARTADARVVAASSVAVYGDPESVPIAEDDPKSPTSPYGIDKLALDRYVRLYHELHGLDTVVLRYFNVYGPGQAGGEYSGVVERFIEQALYGQSISVHGDGEQTRDFVHVADVIRANLAAAATDHVGHAFNVGTGTGTSVLELAEAVGAATGLTPDVVHTDAREGDVRRSCASVSKCQTLLGFTPNVSLEDGLEDLVPKTYQAASD